MIMEIKGGDFESVKEILAVDSRDFTLVLGFSQRQVKWTDGVTLKNGSLLSPYWNAGMESV